MARTIATWSSGGIGNILPTSSSARFGLDLQHARHEADVDAGRIHVAEHAELAHGLDGGRQLAGLGLGAIAVDPAQDMLGGGELGSSSWSERQPSPARPAGQAPAPRPLWNALHFPRALCPADCSRAGEEPCVAVLWRAGLLWSGTFRAACGYGKNLETLEERRTSMDRTIPVAALAIGCRAARARGWRVGANAHRQLRPADRRDGRGGGSEPWRRRLYPGRRLPLCGSRGPGSTAGPATAPASTAIAPVLSASACRDRDWWSFDRCRHWR